MGDKWTVDEESSNKYWLRLVDQTDWYSAEVKWDGCIHFESYYKPVDEEHEHYDYLHICHLDDMIERLQELKTKAVEHFGSKWEGEN